MIDWMPICGLLALVTLRVFLPMSVIVSVIMPTVRMVMFGHVHMGTRSVVTWRINDRVGVKK